MADAALRMRALSLYRSLMRSSRTWPGPPNEKQYIYVSHSLLCGTWFWVNSPAESTFTTLVTSSEPSGNTRNQISAIESDIYSCMLMCRF